MLRTRFQKRLVTQTPLFLSPLPHAVHGAIAGAPYGRAGFDVAEIARWDRALLRDGVGTQALREIGEGREAARFGAVAPVLQLPHELFFGCVGALPHPGELMAHGERELQRAGMLERLRQLDALVAGHRLAAQ